MRETARTATRGDRRARLDAARLYLVIESSVRGAPVDPLVAATLSGGVDVVQLRDKAGGDPCQDAAKLLSRTLSSEL